LSGAASLPDKQLLPTQLAKLSECIDMVSADIAESERVLLEDELSGRRVVRQLPTRDLKLFARSQLQKLRVAGIAQHDAKVRGFGVRVSHAENLSQAQGSLLRE
jgi:hypothetical protein